MLQHLKPMWDILFHPERAARKIPGWLGAVGRFTYLIAQEFSRNRGLEKASALGFQTVFSTIPAIFVALFFFHAFGVFNDLGQAVQRFLYHQLNVDMIRFTTEEGELISLADKIQELVERVYQGLRAPGVSLLSVGWLIIAALSLALTIEKSLNEIWGTVGRRGIVRRVFLYWSVLTLGPVILGISIYAAGQIGSGFGSENLLLGAIGPLIAFYLLYQLVPTAHVRAHAALAGSVVAAVLWQVAKLAFGLYLRHAVGYGKLYGNLGLIPLFLLWVWIAWAIVLVGAIFAYTMQNVDRLSMEERHRHGSPFVHPGLTAVGLVLQVARAFQAGQGSVGAEELAESSYLPDQHWIRLIELLEDRGIVHEVGSGGERFALARPAESLRVEEVFASVEDSLIIRPDASSHPEHGQLRELAQALAEARRRGLGEITFAELMRDGAPTPAEPEATRRTA